MKREPLALLVVLGIFLALPAALFGYQELRTLRWAGVKVIDIIARAPEEGGFSPDYIPLRAGETVKLRLSSPDVVHGLTIPGLGVEVDEIYPGEVVEVDFIAGSPGRYAFACTRWCGRDHWRMRGEIEVLGPDGEPAPVEPQPEPLFQQLGIDLDAMRHQPHELPPAAPSTSRAPDVEDLPEAIVSASSRRALSPGEAFDILRHGAPTAPNGRGRSASPALDGLSDQEVWDLVAWLWLDDTPPTALARAEQLYARDCAACHGEAGQGDGPAGVGLPGMHKMTAQMPEGPADFTDPARMLSASDALLQGKLLRGGMGTGMPEFGSLYTDEELWALVAYLRNFIFDP